MAFRREVLTLSLGMRVPRIVLPQRMFQATTSAWDVNSGPRFLAFPGPLSDRQHGCKSRHGPDPPIWNRLEQSAEHLER